MAIRGGRRRVQSERSTYLRPERNLNDSIGTKIALRHSKIVWTAASSRSRFFGARATCGGAVKIAGERKLFLTF